MNRLDQHAQNQIFNEARTHHAFTPKQLEEGTVQVLYDLCRWAPTAFNAAPARFVFVQSPEAKQLLTQALSEGNIPQTMQAPLTVIVAIDKRFYDCLPELFPAFDARAIYTANLRLAERAGLQNASMQAAYLIMAARTIGLDCGPMTGFNPGKLDELFFPEGEWTSNILINIGYGDAEKLYPRGPRLSFDQACRII